MKDTTQIRFNDLLAMVADCKEANNVILSKQVEVMIAELNLVIIDLQHDLIQESRIVQITSSAIDTLRSIRRLYTGE